MANDVERNYGVLHDYDAVTNADARSYAGEVNIHDKLPLANKTGASAGTGEVYVIDTAASMGFVAASGANDLRPVVVVPQNITGTNTPGEKTILDNEIGWMYAGDAFVPEVDCDTVAVAVGDYLVLSATAKKATSSGKNASSAPPPLGAFAIALSSKAGGSNGVVKAKMLGAMAFGLAGRALSDSAPSQGQVLGYSGSQWQPTNSVDSALVLIEDIELAADAASFDFQNIPQTYKHLKLLVRARTDAAQPTDGYDLRFNNTSTASYDAVIAITRHTNTMTTAEALAATEMQIGYCAGNTAVAGDFSVNELTIPDYRDTAILPNVMMVGALRYDAATSAIRMVQGSGVFRVAGAINRITLIPAVGTNFKAGSRASLYGIG